MKLKSFPFKQVILPILSLVTLTSIYFNGKLISDLTITNFYSNNSSYLGNTQFRMTDANYNVLLFSKDQNTIGSYDQFARQHEWKENYGLLDSRDEQKYYKDLYQISQNSVNELQSAFEHTQTQKLKSDLKKNSGSQSQSDELKQMRTPAAIAMALTAFYTGRMINYSLDRETVLHSQTKFSQTAFSQNQQTASQYFGVDSQIVNSGFEYNAIDPKAQMSKTMGTIGAKAGASFAIASQTASIGVSKSLTDNVSLSYDHSQSHTQPDNHVVGIGFSAGF